MPTEREAFRKMLRENPELRTALTKAVEEGRLKDINEVDPNGAFVIVCGPDHCGIEGSKQVKCECGAAIWMSPSTQEILKEREQLPTRVLCYTCATRGDLET